MPTTNRCVNFSHVSEAKFRLLLKLFCQDLTATQIAAISSISRVTVNLYRALRTRLLHLYEAKSPFSGEVEVDESYFGASRVRGKRGRGAAGKTIVLGVYKRNGNVYTEIIPNVSRMALQQIIRGRVSLESIRSFEVESPLKASFIPMVGKLMTDW